MKLHRKIIALTLSLFGLLALTALMKNFIDLNDVQVVYRQAPQAIARAMRGMKIIFVSDLHIAKIGRRERFVLDLVEREKPDYVLFSGDIIMHFGRTDAALDFYKRLKPRRGAYAVLGDADYDYGTRNCGFCHVDGSWSVRDDLPVRTLRNQVVVLEGPDGPAVELWGKDGGHKGGGMEWTKQGASGLPVISISHYPIDFPRLADAGADLVLSGDTHGGQAYAPRFLRKLFLSPDRFKYLYGRFTRGESVMNVTCGLGWSSLPIRLGVKPEVVIFDFTK